MRQEGFIHSLGRKGLTFMREEGLNLHERGRVKHSYKRKGLNIHERGRVKPS